MTPRRWLVPLIFGAFLLGGAAVHQGVETSTTQTSASEAPPPAASRAMATGDVSQTVRGDLTVRIPAELAMAEGRFDLVIHFHGIAQNQARNMDESHLSAVVVSVNDGLFSDAYAKAFAGPEPIARIVRLAEQEVSAKRAPDARVGRIALSSWSAGGAAVAKVLAREADRVDAVILADGIFSYWSDAAKREVARAPLVPFVDFARKALDDEKLFILTHTAIPTDYPNVEACTSVLLDELGLERGAAPTASPSSADTPSYVVDRASFHVRGFEGKGPDEHIAQLRSLDVAYADLRERWER